MCPSISIEEKQSVFLDQMAPEKQLFWASYASWTARQAVWFYDPEESATADSEIVC